VKRRKRSALRAEGSGYTDSFFQEHCELFHHRPFVWHIWDGRKRDGFHALVNYHKLCGVEAASSRLSETRQDTEMPIPDKELEAVVRIALEARRRVKEQQKRCLKTEFRNTHFSYFIGVDGVEQFVSTPELHSDEAIEADPLPPGQVWAISPGGQEAAPSLYRIEATSEPGNSVKILNAPVPPAFRESVRYGEQNLYSQGKKLVGDRDTRSHEFSVQLRAMDTDRSGHGLSLPVLLALCGSLMERSTKGGLIVVGALNGSRPHAVMHS